MSDTAQDQRGSAAHNVNLSPAVPDDDEYALTDSDLDGMTDAETEGLKEWLNPSDDGGDDTGDDAAGDDATTPEDDPTPEDKQAAADPEPPAQAQRDNTQREQDVSIDLAPKITAKRGELEKLRSDKKALMSEWNDGEVSEEDFNSRLSDMDQEIINLSSEIGSMSGMQSALSETKEAQQRAAQEAADQQWQTTVQAFQSKNPELWGKDHYKAFDATVRSVTANPAVAALPFEKQIEYAAEQYVSLQRALGKPVPTLNGEAATPDPTDPPEADPKPAGRTPPQTLANIPNSSADPHQSQHALLAQKINMATDPDVRERLVDQIPDDMFEEVAALIA